jgi:hypothetical protein
VYDPCNLLQDLAGDAIFLRSVLESKKKAWVRAMLVPYAVFFALACVASLVATGVKLSLFIKKWRSRSSGPNRGHGQKRHSLGGVLISPNMAGDVAVAALKDRFDVHRLERYKYYSYLLLAALEDIPMGMVRLMFPSHRLAERPALSHAM